MLRHAPSVNQAMRCAWCHAQGGGPTPKQSRRPSASIVGPITPPGRTKLRSPSLSSLLSCPDEGESRADQLHAETRSFCCGRHSRADACTHACMCVDGARGAAVGSPSCAAAALVHPHAHAVAAAPHLDAAASRKPARAQHHTRVRCAVAGGFDTPVAPTRNLKVPDVAIPMQHALLKRISAFQSKEVRVRVQACSSTEGVGNESCMNARAPAPLPHAPRPCACPPACSTGAAGLCGALPLPAGPH